MSKGRDAGSSARCEGGGDRWSSRQSLIDAAERAAERLVQRACVAESKRSKQAR